jgi:hypothetical protein
MSNYNDNYIGGRALRVKCSTCERTFHVKFDFRRFQRINVNLPGRILSLPERIHLSDVVIISLSVSGVGFTLKNNKALELGQVYDLTFNLDDDSHAIICEEIIVRRVNGVFVGAEFYHSDRYNCELDFYITAELWGV